MYSDKIKDALKKVGKQKDRINNTKIKKQSRNVADPLSKDKVKVIFTSQNWKTKRKTEKPSHHRQRNITYGKSKSSFDFKGLKKDQQVCCRLQLPWKSQNKHKREKKTIILPCHPNNCRNFHSDSVIKSSSAGRCKRCTRTPSVHYNLVNFPFNAKDRRKVNKGSFLEVKANTSSILKGQVNDPRPFKNQEVSVTSSTIALCMKGGGDTFADKANQVMPKKKENEKLRRIRCYKPTQAHRTCGGRNKRTRLSVLLANNVLKYIIFAISLVVWSPCILITFLIWVVTYPMRPQEIIDTVDSAGQRRNHKKCHGHNNQFLSAIYQSSSAFVKKVAFFYETVFDLLRTEKQESCCKRRSNPGLIRKHSSSKSPNPNKKYTLFYNEERGWVIKPLKSSNPMEKDSKDNFLNTNRNIGIFGKTNLQPDQACQVNFTFGHGGSYKKRSKFSLQCLKMSQAFHNRGQKLRSKPKHKKSIRTQACIGYEDAPGASISKARLDANVVISDTCDAQTNFLNSMQPDIPVYATLQCRKNVKFETEYPECDPCFLHEHPIKRFFCSNNVTMNERMNRPSSIKILKKINPQENRPKYIKVRKYDKDSSKLLPRQHIPERIPTRQFIPKRVDFSRQFIPRRRETTRQYTPSRMERESIRQNIPKRNDIISKNVPKRYSKRNVSSSKSRSNIRKPRKKWFKNAGVGTRFRKKMSYYSDHAQKNMWNYDKCETLYVQTLRRKPCYWIYRRCPSFYPYFMIYFKFYESIVHASLIIMTACIWCPIFFWCYSCAVLLCRCL